MAETYDDVTEPLKNGAQLPSHPALTTSKKVIAYGTVRDDGDGHILLGGLHNNEVAMLMGGQQETLSHLYRFAVRDKKIYHTRHLVTIDVKCVDLPDESANLPKT